MEAEDLVPDGQEDQEVQVTLVAQEVQETSLGVLVEVVQEQMVDQMADQMVDQEVGHSEDHCKGTHWQLALEVASSDWVLVAHPGSSLPSVG